MISRRALLAAPGLTVATAARAVPLAATPIARLDTKWWRERHQAKLVEAKSGPHDLVWLGNSITQNFERNGPEPWALYRPVWERHYGRLHALNLGFKGDATCHLLWRLRHGELDGVKARAAVVLIGANNLGRLHWSAEDTVAGIDAVLAETRRALPGAGILLLGVLPCDRGPWVEETTNAINRSLAARSWPASVVFQDVGGLFRKSGHTDLSLFYDPLLHPPEPALHPMAAGMEMIATAIAPNLARMI